VKPVVVLVDGLNLFHALREQDAQNLDLNLSALSKTLTGVNDDVLIKIFYFTSVTKHLGSKVRDHQDQYLEKLKARGAKVIYGEFRSNSLTCPVCESKYWVHAEKRTDVALASHFIKMAISEEAEEFLLFSADSDFIPAIEMVRNEMPKTDVKVVSTVSYLRPLHSTLKPLQIRTIRLSPELVAKHQFKD
jgi:uncharacterized LabA/DUF88 family protein